MPIASVNKIGVGIAPGSITYTAPKPRASGFIDRVDAKTTIKKVFSEDSFDKTPPEAGSEQELSTPKKLSFSRGHLDRSSLTPRTPPKTTAHKFVKQFETVKPSLQTDSSTIDDEPELSFVNIDDTPNITPDRPKKSILGDSIISAKSIKLAGIRSELTSQINSLTGNTKLQSLLLNEVEQIIANPSNSRIDKNAIFFEALSKVLANLVEGLINNADLAQSLLSLSFDGSIGSLEAAFFHKLGGIITNLDKEVDKIAKLIKENEKANKIDIKIKRYNFQTNEKV